ncbi:hypothetical protein AFULGI_00008890 [Archaeoglobus fulgidus DSM 8774]|uniref:Uncharacterized protein n=1 Tax=Archaeoglobus fulgidus DSM 8774 TaxID=1344584 RepID=A0A075WCH7_ARCFL|nr:hypothetical protein [Archaeoglobus fulgidus]AIG97681.1 hypothetical protein AFULGI_00008890 [Archaeoglobus fulgidus DSM 8774]
MEKVFGPNIDLTAAKTKVRKVAKKGNRKVKRTVVPYDEIDVGVPVIEQRGFMADSEPIVLPSQLAA